VPEDVKPPERHTGPATQVHEALGNGKRKADPLMMLVLAFAGAGGVSGLGGLLSQNGSTERLKTIEAQGAANASRLTSIEGKLDRLDEARIKLAEITARLGALESRFDRERGK